MPEMNAKKPKKLEKNDFSGTPAAPLLSKAYSSANGKVQDLQSKIKVHNNAITKVEESLRKRKCNPHRKYQSSTKVLHRCCSAKSRYRRTYQRTKELVKGLLDQDVRTSMLCKNRPSCNRILTY